MHVSADAALPLHPEGLLEIEDKKAGGVLSLLRDDGGRGGAGVHVSYEYDCYF